MTDLAQVALDFCHECLGWEDVIALPEDSVMGEAAVIMRGNTDTVLHYTDLNVVMREVRNWAARNSVVPKIEVHPERMIVSIYTRSGDFLGSEYYPDLCHGMLVACVNAARKLKAAA